MAAWSFFVSKQRGLFCRHCAKGLPSRYPSLSKQGGFLRVILPVIARSRRGQEGGGDEAISQHNLREDRLEDGVRFASVTLPQGLLGLAITRLKALFTLTGLFTLSTRLKSMIHPNQLQTSTSNSLPWPFSLKISKNFIQKFGSNQNFPTFASRFDRKHAYKSSFHTDFTANTDDGYKLKTLIPAEFDGIAQ